MAEKFPEFGELFRSAEEHPEPVKATIVGSIPVWLKGTLVRLGPGKFDLTEDFTLNHWLDGYAILYKFDIVSDQEVWFSSQFLLSDAYKRAVNVGRPVITEFGTHSYPDPCKNIFSRMMSTLSAAMTDNDAINIFTLKDEVYVATETNWLHRIDPKTLNTCEKKDLNKIIGVNYASSHACTDANGDTYNIGSTLFTGLKYHIFKFPSTSTNVAKDAIQKSTIIGSIPSSWKTHLSYYHSFGLSENYVVLIEQPFTLNGLSLLASLMKDKSLRECLEWRPQEKNKFHVLHKASGKLVPIKYKSEEAFFLFHHVNAYEDDGQLIVDVFAYDSPEIIDKLYLQKLRNSEFSAKDPAGGRRFILPLPGKPNEKFPEGENLVRLENTAARAVRRGDTVHLVPHKLSRDVGYELPSINKAFFTKKYRYYYATGMYDPSVFRNSVLKVNIETGDVLTWRENEFSFPGEAQFVSRPGATDEDDGVLLCGVADVRRDHSDFLLVLDARSMTELARAEVTVHVPAAMHGIFLH